MHRDCVKGLFWFLVEEVGPFCPKDLCGDFRDSSRCPSLIAGSADNADNFQVVQVLFCQRCQWSEQAFILNGDHGGRDYGTAGPNNERMLNDLYTRA